jgi:hypothetical protein
MIPGNTEIPADIQADADKLYPLSSDGDTNTDILQINCKGAYIKGRMYERTNDAIEFADWCTQKEYVKNGSPREWNLGGVFSKRYSDKELYQKWQESKNK